jgi:hypothetical protein
MGNSLLAKRSALESETYMKEGGKSLLDVGGKNSHRLMQIYYTSIAEIKGFRFKSQAGWRRNLQRLSGGANHQSDCLTRDQEPGLHLRAFYYIGRAEGHEYPDLQVGDEVDPRPVFIFS